MNPLTAALIATAGLAPSVPLADTLHLLHEPRLQAGGRRQRAPEDEARLARAEAKRARKAAKRLAEARRG